MHVLTLQSVTKVSPWATPAPEDLIARDEEVEVDARKEFYDNVTNEKDKIKRWRMTGLFKKLYK